MVQPSAAINTNTVQQKIDKIPIKDTLYPAKKEEDKDKDAFQGHEEERQANVRRQYEEKRKHDFEHNLPEVKPSKNKALQKTQTKFQKTASEQQKANTAAFEKIVA